MKTKLVGKWGLLTQDSDLKIEKIRDLILISDKRMRYNERVQSLHHEYDYFSDNIDCRMF